VGQIPRPRRRNHVPRTDCDACLRMKKYKTTNLPSKKYDVLLIDPPWSYYGQQDKWGAAAKFYQTMSDEEIISLPISNLLNTRAVVFVWATAPRLDIALDAICAWGLFYRGVAFTWVKTKRNGAPIKAQGVRPSIVKPTCEFVLVASNIKKGRPLPLASESIVHTVLAPVGEHSSKPEDVQDRIEKMYPHSSRLEMFARRKRSGWDCWGNEV